MNELEQIRSMAEMIIEKVDALMDVKPESKFKVGDRVRSIYGPSYGAIGTVGEVRGDQCHVNFDNGVYHFGYNNEEDLILTKCDTEPKFNADREWHSGPPPHVGWWNANEYKNPYLWRWWNGENWSTAVHQSETAKWAGDSVNWPYYDDDIVWSDYWPANARVPRIDPGE